MIINVNNKPKILVSICNYNHNIFLKESIESIQDQSYDNLDICIYDDGSDNKDEFNDIISSLRKDERIRVISSKENKGKWFGLNQSILSTDALICTAHDADDISLADRIQRQISAMIATKSFHNLCGFYHCWHEEDVQSKRNLRIQDDKLNVIDQKTVYNLVMQGFNHPNVNHYFTGNFETAGVTSMFYRQIWQQGVRFNPPKLGLRTLLSEDSDFNFRMTNLLNNTSILAEQLYLYRRDTSTNREEI